MRSLCAPGFLVSQRLAQPIVPRYPISTLMRFWGPLGHTHTRLGLDVADAKAKRLLPRSLSVTISCVCVSPFPPV
jgi:hypothetical protein